MDYLDKLSQFVAETSFNDLSDEAVSAVRDVTLDTVGAIVAGSQETENAAFAELAIQRSGPGTATILGHGVKAEPMLATLVNSTAGVALEMDEGNRFGGGHPAIHILPGALAVAEEMGASGRSFIEAVLVGYEVESRIGGATKARDNVHSHGHWGAVGTAASVAKLRGYAAQDVRSMINLAASMSPANTWTTAFQGATIRNLYPGRSGLHGILADHLFACGFTGLDDAPSDVYGTIIGESFDAEAVADGLGSEYRIQQNYFKLHACCRYNHPALDAVMQATATNSFALEDVETVEVSVPSMLQGMFGGYPENMLAAKFNVPYAVAAAVVHRKTDISVFRPQIIAEKDIRSVAERVNVQIDPTLATSGEIPRTTASIKLKDGQVMSAETTLVRGDYGNRIPQEELVGKFSFLTGDILGHERAEDVISTVSNLENLDDVRALTEILG
ncbi:MAG: MmgE/PrpD family protein [SAR202 cluster bacterium]|nr:MmgE/PrpD family protein [SAR202 cluster bacterium]MDP6514753.1 MmgE/PrpD family protein [SAR202 cluster bacterium]MDP6716193.1 MmgE/PrpD family protein [SAR202 cluster bacterium]